MTDRSAHMTKEAVRQMLIDRKLTSPDGTYIHASMTELLSVLADAAPSGRDPATIEAVALSIKDELDKFRNPVEFYVQNEAWDRWEKNGEIGPGPDQLESYRIIARAAIRALAAPLK